MNLNKYILIILIFISPLVFSPYFVAIGETPKLIILVIFALYGLLLTGFEIFKHKKLKLQKSIYDIPLFLFSLTYILSALIKTPNKMEAFLLPGTALAIFAGFITFLTINKFLNKDKKIFTYTLVISALIIAIFSVLSFLKVFEKIDFLPQFLKDPLLSLFGGKLIDTIYLVTITPLCISLLVAEKEILAKVFSGLGLLILALAIVINIGQLKSNQSSGPILTPITVNWIVAIDSIKESPIFGFGPGNYASAFSKFLPNSYNSAPYFLNRFTSSRSFVLDTMTVSGILGLSALLFIMYVFTKKLTNFEFQKDSIFGAISLLIIFTSLFIFPVNTGLIIVFYFILSLNSEAQERVFNLPKIIGVTLIIIIAFSSFWIFKAIHAEIKYKRALDLTKTDGIKAYDTLNEAITINKYVDRYRIASSSLNLALADSLSKKKDMTDTDKNTVSQLIQQAIREGKAAVSLNPERSANWEVLATVYQTIIPMVKDSSDFAIQTYGQAVAYDPINPVLRIKLGGIYYSLGKLDEAIEVYKSAVNLKPDFANARYNLAIAYGDKKEYEKAIAEIKIVLELTDKNTEDYKTAQTALENFEKNKPDDNQNQ